MRAREVLEAGNIEIAEEIDARMEKIDEGRAWALLKDADTVYVAKGKKIVSFSPPEEHREEIISTIIGRSGTLRAPTLQIKRSYLVGFNEDMYREILAG